MALRSSRRQNPRLDSQTALATPWSSLAPALFRRSSFSCLFPTTTTIFTDTISGTDFLFLCYHPAHYDAETLDVAIISSLTAYVYFSTSRLATIVVFQAAPGVGSWSSDPATFGPQSCAWPKAAIRISLGSLTRRGTSNDRRNFVGGSRPGDIGCRRRYQGPRNLGITWAEHT